VSRRERATKETGENETGNQIFTFYVAICSKNIEPRTRSEGFSAHEADTRDRDDKMENRHGKD
jgi:hypothetical protein